MARMIFGTISGIVAAFVTVAIVEGAGHYIYPPPPDVDLTKPEALKSIIGQLPLGALVAVVIAWALGAFVGGAVATWLTRTDSLMPAIWVALAMLAASAYTLIIIPHPLWMMAFGLLTPLPLAWIGSRLFAISGRGPQG